MTDDNPDVRVRPKLPVRMAYQAAAEVCADAVDLAGHAIMDHIKAHSDEPDWGHVGDLNHVARLLREINAFLTGRGDS